MNPSEKRGVSAKCLYTDYLLLANIKQWGDKEPADFMQPRYWSPMDWWPSVVNPEPYRWFLGN